MDTMTDTSELIQKHNRLIGVFPGDTLDNVANVIAMLSDLTNEMTESGMPKLGNRGNAGLCIVLDLCEDALRYETSLAVNQRKPQEAVQS